MGIRCHKSNSELSVDLAIQTFDPAIREVASVLRRYRLGYDQSAYIMKMARKTVGLHRPSKGRKLPKSLSNEQLDAFFASVAKGANAEHELMFKLLYATAARCSELTNIKREDVSLSASTIRIVCGKGSKDRVVLFPASLRMALQLHLNATGDQTYLFETRQRRRYSARWVQTLAHRYGEGAGISNCHPHLFRHSSLTTLATGIVLPSGERVRLSDAQLQVQSGHSQRSSLETYTVLGLGHLRSDYEKIMG